MTLDDTYSSIPLGSAPSASSPSSSSNNNRNKHRNKHRIMTILGIQAMVAASYFLLSSPADDDILSRDQRRSLAELAADAKNSEHRRMAVGSSSFLPKLGDWVTWGPVQSTFRRLCTQDDPRTASYRLSLSLDAIDKLIPGFVTEYMSNSDADDRFDRFLSCDVGFNCTYNAATGYTECYDGSTIIDVYESYKKDVVNAPKGGWNNIGYVVTVPECPADENAVGDPIIDNRIYYDTYAVCRHTICGITTQSDELINGAPPDTKYDYTMYAIVHPSAVVCTSSTGAQIDLVAILKGEC